MQLVDVNPIQAQSLQAALDSLPQMLRAGIMRPLVGPWAIPSALGRDHKILGVRCQRFGDQFLAHVRTVRIRGVYKIDAQLHSAAKDRERRSRILGWPPDAVAGDTHRSEAKTSDREFTTQRDCGTGNGRLTFHCVAHLHSPKYPSSGSVLNQPLIESISEHWIRPSQSANFIRQRQRSESSLRYLLRRAPSLIPRRSAPSA